MNWIALKALHEIYESGATKKRESLMRDNHFLFLLQQTGELKEGVNNIVKGDDFDKYYRCTHLNKYLKYYKFLDKNGLLKPQLRIKEDDINIFLGLEKGMMNGDLIPMRNEIIQAEETVRGVSQMFFKNEKYLGKSDSLVNAAKGILGISELANDKDQQYKYVLQSHQPNKIVLCENLDFLKRPSKPRKHNVELWYAGGKNIDKLNYIGEINLPIYYSCDWDYDGLMIYQLVKRKIPNIRLLYPNGPKKSIIKTEHDSHWKFKNESHLLSNLDPSFYSELEKTLILELITSNDWIMEETNDLIEMINLVHKLD